MSSMWMEFYHERAPSSESWWHGKGSRNGARRTGINSKCSCFQVLNEVLENLSKINLHLTDTSLIQSPGPWKTETNLPCAGLTRTAFPFVQVDWVQRVSDSPPTGLSFSGSTASFVILTKDTNIPTSESVYKYSVPGATGIKHRQLPGCPTSPLPPFSISNDCKQSYQKQ